MDWLRITGKNVNLDRLKESLKKIGDFADQVKALPEELRRRFEEAKQAVLDSAVLAEAEELKEALRAAPNLADLTAQLALEDALWEQLDAVIAAIDEVGIDTAGLTEAVSSARDTLGRIPDKYYQLLRHVEAFAEKSPGENPGLVEWAIDDSLTKSGSASDGMALDLAASGTGALQFEAGHLFPFPSADSRYLRIGLRGAVDTKYSGALPLRLGSVAVGAGARGEVRANYMTALATESGTFAREIRAGLDSVINPLDLDPLYKAMNSGALSGMTLSAGGEAFMSSAVALASVFDLAKMVDVSAGLTVDAELRVGGNYTVTARPGSEAGSILVEVMAATSRTNTVGSTLGVTLNASQLAAHIKAQLAPAVAEPKADFGRVEALLQPGALLRSEIKSQIDELFNDAAFSAAAKLAVGEGTESQVKNLLTDRLQNFLDTQAVVWEEKSATAARVGMAWIMQRYPSLDQPELRNKLSDVLDKAVASLQDKVTSEVGKLSSSKLDKLIDTLSRSGIKVQSGADKLDQAVNGVRRALGNHASRVQSFLQKAEELASADLQLQFSSRVSSHTGTSVLASATITGTSKAAEKAYRSLLAGDLDALACLADSPVAGFALSLQEWQRFAEFKRMQGFSLVIFDIELSAKTVFSNKATVTVDQSGALSVLATTDWQRRKKSFKEEQQFLFTSVFSLIAARLTRSFTASLSITQSDKETQSAELERFLRRLEQQSLAAPGVTDSALALVPAQDLQSVVSVEMQLNHDALMRLLFMHEHSERFTKETVARHTLVALRQSGSLSEEQYQLGINAIRRGDPRVDNSMTPEEVLLTFKPGVHRRQLDDQNVGADSTLKALKVWDDAHAKAVALHKMLRGMRKVMKEDPVKNNTSKKKLEQWYQDHQKPIDAALEKWLVIDGTLFNWVSDRISDDAIAFLLVIDRLSGPAGIGGYPLQAYLQLHGDPRVALPAAQ